MIDMFSEYTAHGWSLCGIPPGVKGPRSMGWNLKQNAITAAPAADRLAGAGLCHAWSGTGAVDVDNYADAASYLTAEGIDLASLFNAPGAVQISSGRANRGKLLYAMPVPMVSVTAANGALEFRCGTRGGATVQDVLPPSIHPETHQPYKWIGDWKHLPALPDSVAALWLRLSAEQIGAEKYVTPLVSNMVPAVNNGLTNGNVLKTLRDLLSRRDPECPYIEWIRIGMAINDSTGGNDEGFALWDQWSSASDKYPGSGVLRSHWVSFGRAANPVTIGSLYREDAPTAAEFDDFAVPDEAVPAVQPIFRLMSLPELFSRPEPTWIVADFLPQAGIGAIWGQPSSGKTFVAIDIALAIALGHPWRGAPVKQGAVIYIAAEDDAGVQIRLQSALAAYGVLDAPLLVLPATPVFTDPKQAKALLAVIQGAGPQAVIFVDTLAAVTPGSDENAAKDMGQLVHFCQKLHKVTGGLIILIHHSGKTVGKGMRGSSVLPGAVEVALEITEQEFCREMQVTKQKNAPSGAITNFKLLRSGKSCTTEWI